MAGKEPAGEPPEGFVRLGDIEATVQRLMALARPADAAPQPADAGFANALAIAIAQMSSQGIGKTRPVDPAVMAQRDKARERMVELIVAAYEANDLPVYTVHHPCYFDEVLVRPLWIDVHHVQRKTEIGWPGVPNEALRPVNEVAKGIHQAFLDSIGGVLKGGDGPMRVTSGGLIMLQGQGGRQTPKEAEQTGAPRGAQGLQIRGRGVPGAEVETAVLGTLHPRARQMT